MKEDEDRIEYLVSKMREETIPVTQYPVMREDTTLAAIAESARIKILQKESIRYIVVCVVK